MQPAQFILPKGIAPEKRVDFCLKVINQYRKELVPLRREITDARKWQEYWRQRAQKAEGELKRTKQENERLKKEIEKLTKTNYRYRISLFDHGNFRDPEGSRKQKGGQAGHADTNREVQENYNTWDQIRLSTKHCHVCHAALPRVASTTQKLLVDIVIQPEIVKQVLLSERQWCPSCKREVAAKDTRSLPFTEYGINTFMVIIILRFRARMTLANITTILSVFGLSLSKSSVSNILKQAKHYLKGRYGQLRQAVREGGVIYVDETGWMIHGQAAWMWIAATEEITLYHPSESRGKGNVEELYGDSEAAVMHDGYAAYQNTIPKDNQLFCWAHLLRFAHEETYGLPETSPAAQIREELVRIYHLKNTLKNKETLKTLLPKRLEAILMLPSSDTTVTKIQKRIRTQQQGLINALVYTKDGTNNLAERKLRPVAIAKHVSYGSDTFGGMETTAVIGSIVQTIARKGEEQFLPTLQRYLQHGIQKHYPQYSHVPCYDTS